MTDRSIIGNISLNYCRVFRYSQEQNIYPAPTAFVFRADDYYRNFNEDYLGGKVALFGASRIGVFRAFIGAQYPEAPFIKTKDGWYSVDGKDKDQCVMELGQTEAFRDNYTECTGQLMGREVFD